MAGKKYKRLVERAPNLIKEFCYAYLDGFSVNAAAKKVGIPASTAYEYMNDPVVQAELSRLTRRNLTKARISVERILEELASMAFVDIADVVDADGLVRKKLSDIPEDTRRAITELTVKSIGDFVIETKVRFGSKERCLELLGKYREIAMFKDVVETQATDEVARVQTRSLEERVKAMEKDREASLLKPE